MGGFRKYTLCAPSALHTSPTPACPSLLVLPFFFQSLADRFLVVIYVLLSTEGSLYLRYSPDDEKLDSLRTP